MTPRFPSRFLCRILAYCSAVAAEAGRGKDLSVLGSPDNAWMSKDGSACHKAQPLYTNSALRSCRSSAAIGLGLSRRPLPRVESGISPGLQMSCRVICAAEVLSSTARAERFSASRRPAAGLQETFASRRPAARVSSRARDGQHYLHEPYFYQGGSHLAAEFSVGV